MAVKWRKVLSSSGQCPKPRHGHRAVAVNELMIIFGGGNEGIVDELHVFNTTTSQWFAPTVSGDVPPGCAAFGMVCEGNRIFVFGGMLEYGKYSNDLFELQVGRWQWRHLKPSLNNEDRWPCRRIGHTFCAHSGIGYLFGGVANENDDPRYNLPRYLNDLYTLDLKNNSGHVTWELVPTNGGPPRPRESHSCVVYNSSNRNRLIVYGGMDGCRMDDLWVFDTGTSTWTQPVLNGSTLLPRSLHSATVIGNQMFVFGGWVPIASEDNKSIINEKDWKCSNTFAVFHLDTMTWEQLDTNLLEESLPKPRAGHSAVNFNSRIYIWSGRDGFKKSWNNQVCFKDFWFLETEKPAAPGRVQLVRASTNTLEVSWGSVPTAEKYLLQLQKYDTPISSIGPPHSQPNPSLPNFIRPQVQAKLVQPKVVMAPGGQIGHLTFSNRHPSDVSVSSNQPQPPLVYSQRMAERPTLLVQPAKTPIGRVGSNSPVAPTPRVSGPANAIRIITTTNITIPSGVRVRAASRVRPQAQIMTKSSRMPSSVVVRTVMPPSTEAVLPVALTPSPSVASTAAPVTSQEIQQLFIQRPSSLRPNQPHIVRLVKTSQLANNKPGQIIRTFSKNVINYTPPTPASNGLCPPNSSSSTVKPTIVFAASPGSIPTRISVSGAPLNLPQYIVMSSRPGTFTTSVPSIATNNLRGIPTFVSMPAAHTMSAPRTSSLPSDVNLLSALPTSYSLNPTMTGFLRNPVNFSNFNAVGRAPFIGTSSINNSVIDRVPGPFIATSATPTPENHQNVNYKFDAASVVNFSQNFDGTNGGAVTTPTTGLMQTDGANDSSDDELSQMIGTDESHGCHQLPIDGVDNSCKDKLLRIDGARKSFDELLQTDGANDSNDYELLQTDGANDPVDDETSHNNREVQTNAVTMDGSWAQMSSRHNAESFRPMQISTPADRQLFNANIPGSSNPAFQHQHMTLQQSGVMMSMTRSDGAAMSRSDSGNILLASTGSRDFFSVAEEDPLSTLASAAVLSAPNVLLKPNERSENIDPKQPVLPDGSPLRKDNNVWYDVGDFEATTCTVTHFYPPSNVEDLLDSKKEKPSQVFDLIPGMAYKFRVAGINACGIGPFSEVTAFRTCLPGYPGAPSSIRISKNSEGAQISWQPPDNDSLGAINEYGVYLAIQQTPVRPSKPDSPLQLTFVPVYTGPHAQCIIPNEKLVSAHIDCTSKPAIIFRIAAKNDKGYGPATQVRWLQDPDNASHSSKSLKRLPDSSSQDGAPKKVKSSRDP